MIRRDYKTTGRPQRWALFEQQRHALFAAELAKAWRCEDGRGPAPRRETLNAIAIHDDGWVDWDRHPKLRNGRPVAFDEMTVPDSLAIWTRSIDLGRQAGPFEAFAIAGHFSRLLRTHDSWKDGVHDRKYVEMYLAWSDQLQATCAEEWTNQAMGNSREQCELGTRFVKLFDALSLWLLCADRTEPEAFETPDGPTVTLTPRTPQRIIVAPWPFTAPQLTASATGKLIAAREYQTEEDITLSSATRITLSWHFEPE